MWWNAILIVVTVFTAIIAWRYRCWLHSLRCNECAAPMADGFQRAEKIRSEICHLRNSAAAERGLRVNWGPLEPLSFPCNQCGTVHTLQDGRTLVVAESQQFQWPDPEVESRKVIDSLLCAIDSSTDNESTG